jgi:hypothetical protein
MPCYRATYHHNTDELLTSLYAYAVLVTLRWYMVPVVKRHKGTGFGKGDGPHLSFHPSPRSASV